jgi:hypothetical protein
MLYNWLHYSNREEKDSTCSLCYKASMRGIPKRRIYLLFSGGVVSFDDNEGRFRTSRTNFGLSRWLICYTNIHANLSICLQSFRHNLRFASSLKRQLYVAFPWDAIRKKNKKSPAESRYEHEFLYWDLIVRHLALSGRENKGGDSWS